MLLLSRKERESERWWERDGGREGDMEREGGWRAREGWRKRKGVRQEESRPVNPSYFNPYSLSHSPWIELTCAPWSAVRERLSLHC